MKFAKLFELENDVQVLVRIYCDNENEEYYVEATSEFDGFMADLKYGASSEELARKIFEAYDINIAIKFRNDVEGMFDTEEAT